jgi:hypothetical protein
LLLWLFSAANSPGEDPELECLDMLSQEVREDLDRYHRNVVVEHGGSTEYYLSHELQGHAC